MWIDHGTAPVNDTAAYAVVPGATVQGMSSFLAPTILVNDSTASAVRSGNTTAIVFWTAGSVAGVQSDSPAIVYITPTDLYVSDPTNGAGVLSITLAQGRFTVQRNGGRTFHASLVTKRHRVAR